MQNQFKRGISITLTPFQNRRCVDINKFLIVVFFGVNMRVRQIDISRLQFENVADRCRADVCLHLFDNAGQHAGHVHLNCRANDVENTDPEAIKTKLLGDVRRQMKWMPQGNESSEPLVFAPDMAVLLEEIA